MRKQIAASIAGRKVRVGWLSFQPDGSVSFGLTDRTYIAPRLRQRIGIWNAYNRVKIHYELESDPSALDPVQNPHFTYHPPGIFHLKSNADAASEGEAVFEGIARVAIAVDQDTFMPWARAISAPLTSLPTGGNRNDGIPTEEFLVTIPMENASLCMAVDFIREESKSLYENLSCWCVTWNDVTVRTTLSFTYPHIPTLSWFHSY